MAIPATAMAFLRNTQRLVFWGVALLGLATMFHFIDHWEASTEQKCLSQCEHSSDSSSEDSSPADHQHDCSAHEHSPAILQSALNLIPLPIILTSPEVKVTAPPSIHHEIDQPPRLS